MLGALTLLGDTVLGGELSIVCLCVNMLQAPNRTRPVISEQGPFSAAQSPQALLLAAAMAAGATSTAAAAAAVAGARLLSDVPESLSIDVGKPPRVIDPAIQKDLNQVCAVLACYEIKGCSDAQSQCGLQLPGALYHIRIRTQARCTASVATESCEH